METTVATWRRRSRLWQSANGSCDLILGVLSAVLAMDTSCFAQDSEMTVTTRTSEETVINGYAYADSTCAPIELPRLDPVTAGRMVSNTKRSTIEDGNECLFVSRSCPTIQTLPLHRPALMIRRASPLCWLDLSLRALCRCPRP